MVLHPLRKFLSPRLFFTAALITVALLCSHPSATAQDAIPQPAADATQPEPFKCDFEGAAIPAGWTIQGDVSLDTTLGYKSQHSLLLSRPASKAAEPCSVTSPEFKISPGTWQIQIACNSELISKDQTENGVVTVEYLAGKKVIGSTIIADIFSEHFWGFFNQQFQPSDGADSARIHVQVNKARGKFWIDEIDVKRLSTAVHEKPLIDRMVFSGHGVSGHFLYPGATPKFQVTVETNRPMPANKLTANCIITDYWGAEQGNPLKVILAKQPALNEGRSVYTGGADFSHIPLLAGKYYEIHGDLPQPTGQPYRNYSSFVIEPEAVTNSYKPSEIPFTVRNWDDRYPETIDLAHRMGIRIVGIWNKSEDTPPYATQAIGLDLVKKYKMGAVLGAQTSMIDTRQPGWQKYDEAALRQGIRNTIKAYRKMAEPFIVTLGNEPSQNADWIPNDMKGYKAVYDEIKKDDPSVFVLGTSIGVAYEPFFPAGFGQYCDAYDLHVYETPADIERAMDTYKTWFKKYGFPKPIWATEIGKNSGGMSREAVAMDMIKKFAVFFAGGGVNIGWFDLYYPDPSGHGNDGDSHDTIDARYLQYAPKLTAVTHFDLINSICAKTFVEQKHYGDTRAFLFRDRNHRQLQILWKEKGREDIYLPLPGVKKLELIRIGEAHQILHPAGKGVTLTLDESPLLLLYDGDAPLASDLGPAAAAVTVPKDITRGTPTDIVVTLTSANSKDINLTAPPFWTVKKNTADKHVTFTLICPPHSTVREADLKVTIGSNQSRQGDLTFRPPITNPLSEPTKTN